MTRTTRGRGVDLASLTPVRQLGRGTLCEVILVEDPAGRRFALKRALAEHRDKPNVARLLRDEARVHAQLTHPAIPRLHVAADAGDGFGWQMVFELLDGATLDDVLAQQTKAARTLSGSVNAAAFVVDTVLDALAYVHTKAIVHRDVGPHNVVITRSGDVALIDFGIAVDEDRERWTAAGAVRGTLGYLSPEAVRGEPVDARADLFAAGALFYRLVAGASPFRGKGPRQILNAVAAGAFVPIADVDAALAPLASLFTRALAANPADRFADAGEMRSALPKHDAAQARQEAAQAVQPLLPSASAVRGPTMS